MATNIGLLKVDVALPRLRRQHAGLALPSRDAADLWREMLADRHALDSDEAAGDAAGRVRRRLADLHPSMHCSVIGTCFSTGELRQLMAKIEPVSAAGRSDHAVHGAAVSAASRRDQAGKLLGKALDRRYRGEIARFAAAKDAAAIRRLWDEAQAAGDIPGAYWAVVTHPLTPTELSRHVFSEVHMLSHLVGAANRADIRRLRDLEQENARLAEKLQRQQQHLNATLGAKERRLRELESLLAEQSAGLQPAASAPAVLHDSIRREGLRRRRADERIANLSRRLAESERGRRAAETVATDLTRDLATVERHLACLVNADERENEAGTVLPAAGMVILLVGGRQAQVPPLRAYVERLGGRLEHHDGGIEHNQTSLAGLAGRADIAIVPVDAVSHGAALGVKRLMRESGKPFVPLRTASLAAIARVISEHAQPQGTADFDRH